MKVNKHTFINNYIKIANDKLDVLKDSEMDSILVIMDIYLTHHKVSEFLKISVFNIHRHDLERYQMYFKTPKNKWVEVDLNLSGIIKKYELKASESKDIPLVFMELKTTDIGTLFSNIVRLLNQ